MKKKSFKKLSLNKETISALSENQLNHVKGGDPMTEVDSCCQPKIGCNSNDDPTNVISGCDFCFDPN